MIVGFTTNKTNIKVMRANNADSRRLEIVRDFVYFASVGYKEIQCLIHIAKGATSKLQSNQTCTNPVCPIFSRI